MPALSGASSHTFTQRADRGFDLRRGKKGQAVVELALVVPVLLLLLLGIAEFGRLYGAYLTIEQAAREGARVAALGGTDAQVVQAVDNTASWLDATKITVQINPGDGARFPGGSVTVEVSYRFDFVAPIISRLVGNSVLLRSRMIMRIE